jgi:beta-galactosidase
LTAGLWFGGDYNPEQWQASTWAEDDELMRRARVNTATVGVFSWALLEPREGTFESHGRSWLCVVSHAEALAIVPASGLDLITGRETGGALLLQPDGVAVVREPARPQLLTARRA